MWAINIKNSCTISFNNRYVLVELEGFLTKEFVLETYDKVRDSSFYEPGLPQVWQVTSTDMSAIDDLSIQFITKQLAKAYRNLKSGRVSIICEKNINLTTLKLFKEYSDNERIGVFESFPEATSWIS